MPSKAVEVTIEIVINSVSCPGVWLCAEGDVSLSVFALSSSHHTAHLPPLFPLHYRDTFFFRKRFRNFCSLSNLKCALRGETIYCELVQWKCPCEPCVLAQYLGSLSDLLFPPDTCASDGVDLLMRGTKDFPGILSPKIELSTKVRVDEVYDEDTGAAETRGLSPIGVAVSPDSDFRRQRTVCHSRDYHRNRCSSGPHSPNRRGKAVQTIQQNECKVPCICINENVRGRSRIKASTKTDIACRKCSRPSLESASQPYKQFSNTASNSNSTKKSRNISRENSTRKSQIDKYKCPGRCANSDSSKNSQNNYQDSDRSEQDKTSRISANDSVSRNYDRASRNYDQENATSRSERYQNTTDYTPPSFKNASTPEKDSSSEKPVISMHARTFMHRNRLLMYRVDCLYYITFQLK